MAIVVVAKFEMDNDDVAYKENQDILVEEDKAGMVGNLTDDHIFGVWFGVVDAMVIALLEAKLYGFEAE